MAIRSIDRRRLIIASNRLPLSIKKTAGSFEVIPSGGGLVTALSGLQKSGQVLWLGWPGSEIQEGDKEKITASLAEENAAAVFLDDKLAHDHYNGFSNSVLWPLLHYQSAMGFRTDHWEAYQRANELFAERIIEEAADGDSIWVHDYHLLLLPRLLRKRLDEQKKNCRIGFFLHTPFPADDFWRGLPVQKYLLDGMLASDIIGFHTDEYTANFTGSCVVHLYASGANVEADKVQYAGRSTRVGKYIVGIEPQKFRDAINNHAVQIRIKELETRFAGRQVIIGVDRMDYTKGLPEKLNGFDHFLDEHPEMKTKVVLIQIAVPSREDVKEYQDLEGEVSKRAGQISGKHGAPDQTPLVYLHHSVPFTELTALYCISDICLLTSRRDGMNLVASEYVACQEARHGVLVLSEFAGAAAFMQSGSVLFNPASADELSKALYKAVTMDHGERKKNYENLREFITTHTSTKWAETFLNDLATQEQ